MPQQQATQATARVAGDFASDQVREQEEASQSGRSDHEREGRSLKRFRMREKLSSYIISRQLLSRLVLHSLTFF